MVNTKSNPFLFPFGPWFELQRNLGQGVLNTLAEGTRPSITRGNLYTDEGGATWVAQIPGLNASDLELMVEGRVLTLKTSAGEGEDSEPFEQTLRMSFDVDPDRAEASLHHGLLLVRLPRQTEPEGKRITITGA